MQKGEKGKGGNNIEYLKSAPALEA